MQQDNLLGIIGGLGPMATAYFLGFDREDDGGGA